MHTQTMFELLTMFIPQFEYSIIPIEKQANLIEIQGIAHSIVQ